MTERILQINEGSALLGGTEQHFQDLCTLLTEQGHQVRTFCPGDITVQVGRREIGGALTTLLRQFRPDIVHVHGLRTKHLWILEHIGSQGVPMVQTWHDHAAFCLNQSLYSRKRGYCERCRGSRYLNAIGCVDLLTAMSTYWRRKVLELDPYRQLRRVIVPSRYLLEKAQEWGMPQKIRHIYNFTRNVSCSPSSSRHADMIVFSGRLSRLKGLDVLLEAVQSMDCRLMILGDGELRDKVMQAVETSLPGKILWQGFCTGNEYWQYLEQASVLVLPSICPENCPLTIVDAFSIGIPAVGTSIGGARELIGDRGERGLLVPPDDANALRKALATMLSPGYGTCAKGEAGRRFVLDNMSWEQYYPALLDCYREAVNER